ncbi:hypothetical protein TNCV_2655871 [Trichonephila clavipes]|nr:hypothetical protein TNCV_2655871 [Trichonephila clavipes]
MAEKEILEFVQSSKNIDADSDDKKEMYNAAPVPTSSVMRNIVKRRVWVQVTRSVTNRGNQRKEKWSYRFAALLGGGSRCLTAVQHDASQQGKAPFVIVLNSTMGDFTYAEDTDMCYMYGRANSNGRAALRMYHALFPDRRMPDNRNFSLVTSSTS